MLVCIGLYFINGFKGYAENPPDVIIGINPNACTNCIIGIQSIDSFLKVKKCKVYYYLPGLRGDENKQYARQNLKGIRTKFYNSRHASVDSAMLFENSVIYFSAFHRTISLADFWKYRQFFFPVTLMEKAFAFSGNSWFLEHKKMLYYNAFWKGGNQIARINTETGKTEIALKPITHELKKQIYQKIFGEDFQKYWGYREKAFANAPIADMDEITTGFLAEAGNSLLLPFHLSVCISENDQNYFDVIIEYDLQLKFLALYVAEKSSYVDKWLSIISMAPINFNPKERTFSCAIAPIYRQYNTLDQPVGFFRLVDGKIKFEGTLSAKADFLVKRPVSGNREYMFNYKVSRVDKELYITPEVPVAYDAIAQKEVVLFSFKPLTDFDYTSNTFIDTSTFIIQYFKGGTTGAVQIFSDQGSRRNYFMAKYDDEYKVQAVFKFPDIDKTQEYMKFTHVSGEKTNIVLMRKSKVIYYSIPHEELKQVN